MTPLDPARTALLLLDLQPAIIARLPAADQDPYLDRIVGLLAAFRAAGATVAHVRVGFTAEDLARVPAHSSFAAILDDPARRAELDADAPSTRPDARVAPREGEIVVRKTRVGPFSTTDLAAQLRGRGVDTLVLAGLSTSGVVLSTVRQAADDDWRLVVVRDGCADPDAEVHRVLLERVLPRQAEVVRSAEAIATVGEPSRAASRPDSAARGT